MEANAKIKTIGSKWSGIKIILPDCFAPYLEKYDLEIVQYPMFKSMGVYFINKECPKEDSVSFTIRNPNFPDNIKEGFKEAFELLQRYEADRTAAIQKTAEKNDGTK